MLSVVRSRMLSNISKTNINWSRVYSSNVIGGALKKEPILSSQSIVDDLAKAERKSPWRFLKYGLVSGFTGATAGVAYVTYAYSADEIDEKMKALLVALIIREESSTLEKYQRLFYSAAMTVCTRAAFVITDYLTIRRFVEEHPFYIGSPSEKLLPDLHPAEQHVFTLVLDINETLLYSARTPGKGRRTIKRPGVDDFLEKMAKFYEIVVFTDRMDLFVDIYCRCLDSKNCIRHKLSMAANTYQDGEFYRDLSRLNRDPAKILYVSGHAFESCLQPENCVPIKPFKLEEDELDIDEFVADDTTLLDLIPFLEFVAHNSPADIRTVLASYERKDIAKEFLERRKELVRQMEEGKRQNGFWRVSI